MHPYLTQKLAEAKMQELAAAAQLHRRRGEEPPRASSRLTVTKAAPKRAGLRLLFRT